MISKSMAGSLRGLGIYWGALMLAYAGTLFQLVEFAFSEDLFSYTLLVPAISAWLVWQKRGSLDWSYHSARYMAAALAGIGSLLLLASWLTDSTENQVARLSLGILSFIAFAVAGLAWQLGGVVLRQVIFPASFLLFMAPLPPGVVQVLETGLQHASAEASDWLFELSGTTYLRQGLVFQLPGITFHVAPECSGIRSTLVLFMTSLIAGHLFLRRRWQCVVFSLLVIPLGIARNAIRIATIGLLCVRYGPQMIDSPIHHRGGPFFFALSLIPLFLVLYFFRRWDSMKRNLARTATEDRGEEQKPAV